MTLRRVVTNVQAGVLTGFLNVVSMTTYAALIFSGPLQAHLATGIVLLLISTVVLVFGGTVGSDYRGMISSVRGPTIPLLAAMAAAIAQTMGAQGRESGVMATVIAAIAITGIASGLVMALLGQFRMGRLVRYFPYPVIAGFLAGVGYHLLTGGLSIAAGQPIAWDLLSLWLAPQPVRQWPLALAFGVVMFILQRQRGRLFVVPALLLVATAAFHAVLASSGQTLAEAAAAGWLPSLVASPLSLPLLGFDDLASVHWPSVAAQAGDIAAVATLCAILLLLDVAAIEVIVNREIRPNHELKVAGVTSVVCGLAGGCPGVPSLTDTAFAYRLNGDRRLTGAVTAVCLALAAAAGVGFVRVVPMFVLGGLLVYLGIDFLWQWVWEARKELPLADFLVVLLILVACVWKGIHVGMVIGVLVSVVLFVITYSRLATIKSEYTGRDHVSHIERDPQIRTILDRESTCIVIMKLQGAIFFGTASDVTSNIGAKLASPEPAPVKYLVLDLKHVNLMDTSGIRSLTRLAQLTESRGVSVAVTGHDARIREQLERSGFFTEQNAAAPVRRCQFAQLDEGVAWCENRILDDLRIAGAAGADTLEDRLARMLADRAAARAMAPLFRREEHAAGSWLVRRGEPGECLYLVDSGLLSVVVDTEDGEERIVGVYTGGAIIGEMAVYMEGARTAGVRIDRPSVLFRLDADALRDLQVRHPEAAGRFHTFVVRMIAGRLDRSTRELRHHL